MAADGRAQTEEDLKLSADLWKTIGTYMQAKYDADKDLARRTAFKWTMVRPGWLSDEPGTGRAIVGKAHISGKIPVCAFLRGVDAHGLTAVCSATTWPWPSPYSRTGQTLLA